MAAKASRRQLFEPNCGECLIIVSGMTTAAALSSALPHRSAVSGASVYIKGSIVSGDDLYFNGELEGTIEAIQSTVTIGPNAKITASIKARRVVVLGTVRSHIVALDSILLGSTCNLIGNLITTRIAIEDGACYKGSIHVRSDANGTPVAVAQSARA